MMEKSQGQHLEDSRNQVVDVIDTLLVTFYS